MRYLLFLCLSVSLIGSPLCADPSNIPSQGWMEEYQKAKDLAAESRKSLLLVFLGGSTCPWSEKLEQDVLSDPEFTDLLQNDCLLVKISQDKVVADLFKELKGTFQLQEWPTLLLLTSEGEEIIKEGYLPLSVSSYAGHIKESLQEFVLLKQKLAASDEGAISEDELEKMYAHARKMGFRTCKEEIFQRGLKLKKNPYFLIERYETLLSHLKKKDPQLIALRKKIFSMDSKNVKGTRLRMAIIDFMKNVAKAKPKGDPKHVVAPLVEYSQKFGDKDTENLWKVEMMIAQYLFSKNKTSSAVKHAKRSSDVAPDIIKNEVEQTLQYMKSRQEAM